MIDDSLRTALMPNLFIEIGIDIYTHFQGNFALNH